MRKVLTNEIFCDLMGILHFSKGRKTMERSDYIVNILVTAGFKTSLKGFPQLCAVLGIYIDSKSATLDSIYGRVSVEFCCTKSSVEKNIRRLFESADACAVIGRLYGMTFADAGNKEIIAMLANYVMLQHDCYIIKDNAVVASA